ncbi:MAG: Hsp33 family molecular chaperone HslO [Sphingomonadaceae bacterium]|nr:Hsp33 family molecular chaperone HslO [Sphingomonadaceae bacterium]
MDVQSIGALNGAGLRAARPDTQDDQLLPFAVPSRDVRGRLVRLGPAMREIMHAHAYPPPVARLLGEALTLTALIGSLLREEGRVTVQAQSKGGPVDLLVCDWDAGALRGYLRHDPEKLSRYGKNPSVRALMGQGYLAITLEQTASVERYQGIVSLEGGSLAAMAESYFQQSEQLPTRILTSVSEGGAGGLLVQHLARAELGGERLHVTREENPDWSHVRLLAETVRRDELLDPALPLPELLWRLLNEDEVRVGEVVTVRHGCRCSEEHILGVLKQFTEEDLADMRDETGAITVDCAFCAKKYVVRV